MEPLVDFELDLCHPFNSVLLVGHLRETESCVVLGVKISVVPRHVFSILIHTVN